MPRGRGAGIGRHRHVGIGPWGQTWGRVSVMQVLQRKALPRVVKAHNPKPSNLPLGCPGDPPMACICSARVLPTRRTHYSQHVTLRTGCSRRKAR